MPKRRLRSALELGVDIGGCSVNRENDRAPGTQDREKILRLSHNLRWIQAVPLNKARPVWR
jgi:hypothetical protein